MEVLEDSVDHKEDSIENLLDKVLVSDYQEDHISKSDDDKSGRWIAKNLLDEVLVSRPTGRALALRAEDSCCPLLLQIVVQ